MYKYIVYTYICNNIHPVLTRITGVRSIGVVMHVQFVTLLYIHTILYMTLYTKRDT